MNLEDDTYNEEVEETAIDGNSWKKLSENSYKAGYRDGITDGKEVKVQDGFNAGYSLSYQIIHTIAFLRGVISTFRSRVEARANVADLHRMVVDLEKKVVRLHQASLESRSNESELDSLHISETPSRSISEDKFHLVRDFDSCKVSCCVLAEELELFALKEVIEALELTLE